MVIWFLGVVLGLLCGGWRLEAGSWRRGAMAALTRLETGGEKLETGGNAASGVALLQAGERLETGCWMLEPWCCGCFDEAGGVALLRRRLET